ncbi:LysR family transcriptional regulator ArgP [Pseudodesulfovibrio senegalensis]|jgi:LysR family transcriptional regulator (chromosome initiation inhibitor)|uniref:LysR family transcriptional regulator ArgP n=1 Tax=Pseudodesulfovibrio senegalensis TaxID=1721087 RepID=A0A6N6N226_9BACT|nr:LysR family transcriptional regulator ArgP [Pseudodesulfovibrio senegalensis]KAB1440920.1 LysR family transcriptional regulator ArgP [Pseudodesulfovibrio senegalensis]
MLDYKLLEAMAAVVDEGGFERAARVLHLTQSAVSQRVKLLEEQSGQILLVRSHPPQPTEAGMRLLKHCRQVRRLEDDLDVDLNLAGDSFTTLPVGINADSLATWFLPAMQDYLAERPVLLDLRSDDQDQTHRLLRDGVVLGCVSSRSEPFQGCRCDYLGHMDYRLLASPGFRDKWFSGGFSAKSLSRAPMLIYNRKDEMHVLLLQRVLGACPDLNPFYVPSSGRFADFIAQGLACGMLPEQQCGELVAQGRLVNLIPGESERVDLFWHCWNIESSVMDSFSRALKAGASRLLARNR